MYLNYMLRIHLLVVILFLSACNPDEQNKISPVDQKSINNSADLAFVNGDIYTVDAKHSWAEAVAIRDNKIIYVGTNQGINEFIDAKTRQIDLNGKMVLPGFQDVHIHTQESGVSLQDCTLFDYYDVEAYVSAVKACADARPDAEWIRGIGWSVTAFPPDGIPHKSFLDKVVPHKPVALVSSDGHSLWVNSKALVIAAITKDTPDPEHGRIDREPKTNEPVGSFQELSAMTLIRQHITPYTDEELDSGLYNAIEYLNSLGITAWQDAQVRLRQYDAFRTLEMYTRMDNKGQLTARVVTALFWDHNKEKDHYDEILLTREIFTRGNINSGTVKIWLDGVLEPNTAALLEDYSNQPGHKSQVQIPPEELNEIVTRLDAAGFQVHIHVIGDAATRYALNAIEHAKSINGSNDNRHHLAHVQLVHPDDVSRFGELDVTASFQPLWAYNDDYITELYPAKLGPIRLRWNYPIGSILRSGGRIAFGSDWWVTSPDPLLGIEVAVTRLDPSNSSGEIFVPEERITLTEAIAAYTINAAFINHLDDKTGSIEVGKLADLIVLDKNLFKVHPSKISEAKVLLTLFDGKVVYGSLDKLSAH